jgi:hypothetical protein
VHRNNNFYVLYTHKLCLHINRFTHNKTSNVNTLTLSIGISCQYGKITHGNSVYFIIIKNTQSLPIIITKLSVKYI